MDRIVPNTAASNRPFAIIAEPRSSCPGNDLKGFEMILVRLGLGILIFP
jgi:hypothetical protein